MSNVGPVSLIKNITRHGPPAVNVLVFCRFDVSNLQVKQNLLETHGRCPANDCRCVWEMLR